MLVKMPSGMLEADLARPVVEVRDFFTKKIEFEIYTYGEETTIVPVKEARANPLMKLAEGELRRLLKKEIQGSNVHVEMTGEGSAAIYVSADVIPAVIGTKGRNIIALEKKIGLKLDVRDIADVAKSDVSKTTGEEIQFDVDENKKALLFYFDKSVNGRQVDFKVDGDFVFSAVISQKGRVNIGKRTEAGGILSKALNSGKKITVSV